MKKLGKALNCEVVETSALKGIGTGEAAQKAAALAGKKAAELHREFAPYIVKQVEKSAVSGEPIVRHMEYSYPHRGFERCLDQFMLGEDYLVAPVVIKGQTKREVKLPQGKWLYLGKKEYEGGQAIVVDAPIEVLPYFKKI